MKIRIAFLLLTLALASVACEENEVLPGYQKKGTTTTTVATISSSNAKPAKATDITLTLKYVNPLADPVKTVELRAKVGSGTYATVQTFDTQSDTKDTEVTREVVYTTPGVSGTVTFDMVITSQMPYPQIQRTSVSVQ
ncbi:hypothetical protein WBG78_03680 [Chryseolinea sp. T2]|uniref:hypothetical protein n=1 Tax=Chryseolinea sp. T2 TaxID=3129255 RepID=UPI003076FE19